MFYVNGVWKSATEVAVEYSNDDNDALVALLEQFAEGYRVAQSDDDLFATMQAITVVLQKQYVYFVENRVLTSREQYPILQPSAETPRGKEHDYIESNQNSNAHR